MKLNEGEMKVVDTTKIPKIETIEQGKQYVNQIQVDIELFNKYLKSTEKSEAWDNLQLHRSQLIQAKTKIEKRIAAMVIVQRRIQGIL